MEQKQSLALLILVLASSFLLNYCQPMNCEQLSTVFVLETSDSAESSNSQLQPSASAQTGNEPQARSLEDSNTRVITDDEAHQVKTTSRPVNRLTDAQVAASRQPSTSTSDKSQPKAVQAYQSSHNNNKSHQNSHSHQLSSQQSSANSQNNQQRDTHESHNHNNQDGSSYIKDNTSHSNDNNNSNGQHNQQYKQATGSTNNHHVGSSSQDSATGQLTETRRLDDDNISYSQDQDSSPTSSRPRGGSVSSATRSSNTQINQPSSSSSNSQQRPKLVGSASESEESTRKPENRLLISITEDEDRGPHKHLIGGSGSLTSLGSSGIGNEENHLNKKKQSITISFQDASKPVIVRPSENGIVISTVNGDSNSQLGNNGYSLNTNSNSNKPSISGINRPLQPGSSSSYQNNNNERPYSREPTDGNSVSIPLPVAVGTGGHNNNHNNHNNYNTGSTTYRPSSLISGNQNDYSSSNSNNQRPITSTLVDQPPRLPVLVGGSSSSEERPQRPTSSIGGSESSFENQRPSVRPPINRPPLDTNSGSNEGPIGGDLSSSSSELVKFPLNEKNCGLVHETKIVGGEEADPADFLWMAAIIRSKPTSGEVRPFCGGSLITRRHILTAAHCLENLAPRDVLVRLGSYDFDDATASSFSADYAIDQFRVPATYSKKTHAADIAIMRLKTPLQTSDNYKTVCMPQPRRSYVGALGTVTGYGSQSQTFRRAAPKLRQVTVPIWENRKCSVVYKRNLTESFLCAGYEEGGKDACQGDSGGPLMTEGPNERMMIVGVVSHGIGCGSPGYPGVYTRTTTFLDWIEKNTRE